MPNTPANSPAKHVVIIGAGFTGLSAAHTLAKQGVRVSVFDSDTEVGGLASTFAVGETKLERFYHHWFTSDRYIFDLIKELDLLAHVSTRATNTGMYFANKLFRLASPFDLLKFTPLPFIDRIRLGLLVLKARREKDWQKLDSISAADWLRDLAGENVFTVVWEPLLRGKFGKYADDVSASWFWAKLVLRGGSRGKGAKENLAYFRGGFAALAEHIVSDIRRRGGDVKLGAPVQNVVASGGKITGVYVNGETVPCDAVIATPALPIIERMTRGHVPEAFADSLQRIEYLANVCLILILDRSLSDLYWMNVNDASFPFVGIIEHTNFEPPKSYGGGHVVYLSKYLTTEDALYRMTADEALAFSIPHIQRMFPDFRSEWIKEHHVWHAEYAQPVVDRGYKDKVPAKMTPLDGLYISTMAQVYPEDRGTNHAVREGIAVAELALKNLKA